MRRSMRITAAALALVTGLTGAAQAENFNIFSASKAQQTQDNGNFEQARRYGGRHWGGGRHWRGGRYWGGPRYGYYRRGYPGAALALGTFGLIAGTAAAAAYGPYGYGYGPRYYCDPYYEYCGPRYRRYYAPRYYAPRPYYYYD